MARVTVKGLWKRYGDSVVLENINLDFADHEFVTIVGASGCGKTTFLRILLGMEQPTRGKLLIDGSPVPPEPGPDRGIVFQEYALYPWLTVRKNILFGLERQNMSVPEREKIVISKIPAKRIADADDIVGVAILLASPAGSYISGQVLVIDGGRSIT